MSQLIQCFLKANNHCSEPNLPTEEGGFPKSKHLEASGQHRNGRLQRKHLNSQRQCVPTPTLPTEATHTALHLKEERSLKNGTVIFFFFFVRPPHQLQQVVPQSPAVLRIYQTFLVKMVCSYINLRLYLPWLCRWNCSCSFGNICPEKKVF